jgi:hypothetical protein
MQGGLPKLRAGDGELKPLIGSAIARVLGLVLDSEHCRRRDFIPELFLKVETRGIPTHWGDCRGRGVRCNGQNMASRRNSHSAHAE